MVTLFKVLLPLAALAILSTLFMLSRSVDPIANIPFAEREIAERTRDQQITAPFFSGTTDAGDEIIVTASLARPERAGAPAEATDLMARITMVDGVQITLTSNSGSVAIDRNMARFSGNVEITSSVGLVVRTDILNTALDGISGNTPGTITGTGPFGDFVAGQMQFSEKYDGGPLHMLFKNGVKLIYHPKALAKDLER